MKAKNKFLITYLQTFARNFAMKFQQSLYNDKYDTKTINSPSFGFASEKFVITGQRH